MSSTAKRKRVTNPGYPSPVPLQLEGPDFINRLPDCILISILSLLPAQDAARTSLLSSRWRHLWKSASLRLDVASDEQTVSSILNSHHGPIESLHLSLDFSRRRSRRFMDTDRLLETAVERGIPKLTLFCLRTTYELPPFLLRCNSLHQLSLSYCRIPKALPPIFPNLKELRQNSVLLDDNMLEFLLLNCESLETLHLISTRKAPVISISSPSLHKLVFDKLVLDWEFRAEFIIKDAPNLESLMLGEYETRDCMVKILNAPKLQLLGFLCVDFKALQLGGTLLQQQPALVFQINAMPYQMTMLLL